MWECQQACGIKDICTLPKETGSCKVKLPSYYFNSKTDQCEKFNYSGCGGNYNRFPNKRECELACGKKKICTQPQEKGSCKEKITSYYFNFKSGQCEKFTYSGCDGNDNRFSTEKECKQACGDICNLPLSAGFFCSGFYTRYYFNSEKGKCEEFVYHGCDRNDNHFLTMQECEQECRVKDPRKFPFKIACWKFHRSYYYNPKYNTCQRFRYGVCGEFTFDLACEFACVKKDLCTLPKRRGPCAKKFLRYYFNSKTGECEEFIYGGCFGNDNRFSTKRECEIACKKGICALPQDAGPCAPFKEFTRYYFNSKTGKCEKFLYGGCLGNENRYMSKKECEQACDTKVICTLPKETGHCEENIPSFYFNSKNGLCERFTYSGCAGNNNRFSSKRDCEVVCGKKNICTQPQEKGTCKDEITNFYFNFKT